MIGEDGRMTAAAGERFAGMTVARGARGGRRARCARRAGSSRTEPYTHNVPFSAPLRRAHRAADLAAVVHAHGRARRARDRGRPRRARPHPPRGPAPALPRVDGEHPALVHLAPAVVGPPDPRLVPRRGDLRRHRAARGRGLGAGPRRARHLVLLGAVAVRDARLARGHAGAARLLPDRRALDGARHPLPLGRADGHDGARVHRRHPVRRRQRPLDHPGARRPADVQVARHRDRPARADRGGPRPPVFAQGGDFPAYGADAVRFGLLAMSSTQDVRFTEEKIAQGRQLANKLFNASRLVLLRVPEGDAARAAPARDGRGRAGSCRACSGPRPRRSAALEDFEFHRAALGLYDFVYGELCDWYLELSSRACTPTTTPGRRGRAARAARDARARPPGDPVRHRGDLVATCPAPRAC